MNVIGTLLALVLLITGGAGHSGTLALSDATLDAAGGRMEWPLCLEVAVDNGDGETVLDLSGSWRDNPIPSTQALLTDDVVTLNVDGDDFCIPGRALRYGDDLTELDAALLAGTAALNDLWVEVPSETWVTTLRLPEDRLRDAWTMNAAQMGALLDDMAEGLGGAAGTLYRALGESRRAFTWDRSLGEIEGFGPILGELGFTEFRWQPAAGASDNALGELTCTLELPAERWEAFRDLMRRELRADPVVVLTCVITDDMPAESAKKTLESRFRHAGLDATVEVSPQGDALLVRAKRDMREPQMRELILNPGRLEFRSPDGDLILDNDAVKSVELTAANAEKTLYAVRFQLNDEGTATFEEATRKYLGSAISIYLNDELVSAPTVQAVITNGIGLITGSNTESSEASYEWADALAKLIGDGALYLRIDGEEIEGVGVSLLDGAGSAQASEVPVRLELPLRLSGDGDNWSVECPLDSLGLEGSRLFLRADPSGVRLDADVALGRGKWMSARLAPEVTVIGVGGRELIAETDMMGMGRGVALLYEGGGGGSARLSVKLLLGGQGTGSVSVRMEAFGIGLQLNGCLEWTDEARFRRVIAGQASTDGVNTRETVAALAARLMEAYAPLARDALDQLPGIDALFPLSD